MKKIFALLLALCLVCVSAAALAEAVAEAKTVELDGFSLNLQAGEYYFVDQKAVNQVYVTVYPYYANGDTSSNYNFGWAGDVFEVTVDDVKAQAAAIEENIRTTLEANGISLDSFTVGDPYDATLNDVPCIALEFQMDISAFGMTMTVYQREILVGSIGYTITISAMTPDSLDEMTQLMADALNM